MGNNKENKLKNSLENHVGCMVKIYGIVQGVGFRPYVYKKAKEFEIRGWVNNCDASVIINAEGERKKVQRFIKEVVEKPPNLSEIQKVEVTEKNLEGYKNFTIKKSIVSDTKLKFILPDIATCDRCIEDIFDEKSKRYRYAFTNCTLCGPRYSIIKSLPYDRCNTTMRDFKMCPVCESEYQNPETRRFHAQPTCCIDCGPELFLTDNRAKRIQCEDDIKECALLLKQGKILGIKGIGGFHIVCSAFNEEAILKIRKRKERIHKPLAVMMKDIEIVKKYCEVSKREEEILISNKRPIVLLTKKHNNNICSYVAPNMKSYGVMLPYTPIHHLLFAEDLPPLVMTSGNLSGSPIEYTNEGALKNLSTIVEFFLFNNRKINTPVDDSVVKVVEDKIIMSRPGRGFSPYYLYGNINNKILALGGEEKSTFSFSLDGMAYISQYLGDLKELMAYKEYLKCIKNIKNIFEFQEEIVTFDMHPNYMSAIYGKSLNAIKVPVQHHHAHMVSCMLEHNIWEKVIGIIYDGTGYGMDRNIWGGEFFIGNRRKFKRVGHFKYTKIQGGDSAQKNIWKIGLSYLKNIKDREMMNLGLNKIKSALKKTKFQVENTDYNFSEQLWEKTIENLWSALDKDLNCYKTSSVGRLFDAVSSILGLREKISYDAQGAIELENILDETVKESYPYVINCVIDKKDDDSMYVVDYLPMLIELLKDIQRNVATKEISAKFHNTIINITVEMAKRLREQFKINIVVLSGGVFENRYILNNTYGGLKEQGFQVFFNEKIPTNDSGISLGQVAIADEIVKHQVSNKNK